MGPSNHPRFVCGLLLSGICQRTNALRDAIAALTQALIPLHCVRTSTAVVGAHVGGICQRT
jgi:hypothetical protein